MRDDSRFLTVSVPIGKCGDDRRRIGRIHPGEKILRVATLFSTAGAEISEVEVLVQAVN